MPQDPPEPSPQPEPASSQDSGPVSPATEASPETGEAPGALPAGAARSSGLRRGFLDLLLLLILAGLAGADYLLYRMLEDRMAAVSGRMATVEQRLQALESARETEPDSARTVAALQQQVRDLNNRLDETLARQQALLEGLREQNASEPETGDEEENPEPVPPPPPAAPEVITREPAAPRDTGPTPAPGLAPQPADEQQARERYVDFVESTGARLWRWITEGATRLWDTVKDWLGS